MIVLNLLQYILLALCAYLGFIAYDRFVILAIAAALIATYVPQRIAAFREIRASAGGMGLVGACVAMLLINIVLSALFYFIGYGAGKLFQ